MVHDDVLSSAIKRNLNEIGTAICQRKALVGMEKADTCHSFDFVRITYIAIKNDMIAHTIKVLDKDDRSATFWLIYKVYKEEIDAYLHSKSISININVFKDGNSIFKTIFFICSHFIIGIKC